MFCDSAHDFAHVTAYLHGEFEELVRFFNLFRSENFAHAKLNFCKIVNGNFAYINDIFRFFVLFFLFFFSLFLLFFLLFFGVLFHQALCKKLFFHLVGVYSCKQMRGVFRNFRAVCQKSEFVEIVKRANCRPALFDHFLRGGRHKRRKQTCANHDGFGEVVKHGCQSVFLAFVLCKHPRHSFVDILVCSSEHGEYIRKRVCRAICVDICKHLVSCRFCKRFKLVVNGFAYALVANDAAEILVAHGDCSLHEVAVHVDKLAVDGIDNQIPADYAVVVERHLRKQIISYAVNAEKVHEIVGINDVAFGL